MVIDVRVIRFIRASGDVRATNQSADESRTGVECCQRQYSLFPFIILITLTALIILVTLPFSISLITPSVPEHR